MKRLYLMYFLLLILQAGLFAQVSFDKVFTIIDGRMVFTFDQKWNALQRYEVAKRFDLDSLLVERAYKGEATITLGADQWTARRTRKGMIELSKPLGNVSLSQMNANDIFMVDDNWLDLEVNTRPVPAKFGFNDFSRSGCFSYKNETAHFFLPGYKNAVKVYISGTFNNWNTQENQMMQVDSGWLIHLRLPPGKYAYKFIVDGKWKEDPDNRQQERYDRSGYNSVVFCTNYEFHLKGYAQAKKVILSGSFNGWNHDKARMLKSANGWTLPVYLSNGTHAYKFIVDNQWITDPANPDVRKDADGNLNSFIGLGESYTFKLVGYGYAKQVVLSGSFNDWSTNELLMHKMELGWELPYILAPGLYEYKFLVDGTWIPDPRNPFTRGTGDYTNSVLAFKPNYTFVLDRPEAKQVILTGNFCSWDRNGYRMILANGKWIFPVYLEPGKYLYKFIVDGDWILDPANKLWEDNEYGTGNSVLWIGQ